MQSPPDPMRSIDSHATKLNVTVLSVQGPTQEGDRPSKKDWGRFLLGINIGPGLDRWESQSDIVVEEKGFPVGRRA